MLSVIIPMYNEEKNCRKCILTLDTSLSESYEEYEIVAVNDGSTDNTGGVLASLKEEFPHLSVCSYEKNRGKGYAVRRGMEAASGDTLLYTDCDLAYGADAVKGMYEFRLSSGKDIIIGSRNLSEEGYAGYTPLRRLASKLYIKTVCLFAGFDRTDSQCGIKCFERECGKEIFSKCEVDGFAFDLEALMIGKAMGCSIEEFPVKIVNHSQSSSKVNVFRDTLKMLRDLRKIKKRVKSQL